MYIATVPNRGSPPAILLRESYREDGKVKSRTLANLTRLPGDALELVRGSLKGESFVSLKDDFDEVGSRLHGHVEAVRLAMRRLAFEQLIASRPSQQRDLVVAMIVARIIEADSKLATTRWWKDTTLPDWLEVGGADEDQLYAAMDWLLARQARIEKKLAGRHLHDDGLVLYDLSSSYFEGKTCPLAAFGHNRDGKAGKLQVNYGLLTDDRGCPVAVSVFEGNTTDSTTVIPEVRRLQDEFGVTSVVLVGDRGMISQKQIHELRDADSVDWISAIKSAAIRKLIDDKHIQPSLFDEKNLFELTHPGYPGERLIACRNPTLARLRGHKRQSLVDATAEALDRARSVIEGGKLRGAQKIRQRARGISAKWGVSDFIRLDVRDDSFRFELLDELAAGLAALEALHEKLSSLGNTVRRGKLEGKDSIAARAAKILGDREIAALVELDIVDDAFEFNIPDGPSAAKAVLHAVVRDLTRLGELVTNGRFGGKDAIGVRVGKVINKHKVAKHFVLDIRDDGFDFSVDADKVAAEAALDGIYVVRTSVAADRLSGDDTVRSYKKLSQVERAFRSIKTVDLKVRPIHHHLETRVRAHIFLCMLAYYVEWYMREAWRPLLFCDEDFEAKKTRDPVAPAERSAAAESKAQSKVLEDGTEVHSFRTLLRHLSTIVCNICRVRGAAPDTPTVEVVTTPSVTQRRAYELLEGIAL